MQKLVRVKLSVDEYVREQFHKRMRAPFQCPNCGHIRRLWALGYYQRYTTGEYGKAIAILVRRFRCMYCGVTVSCLPCFALPYRLINHTTLEAFITGRHRQRDVQAQWDLLQRYLEPVPNAYIFESTDFYRTFKTNAPGDLERISEVNSILRG